MKLSNSQKILIFCEKKKWLVDNKIDVFSTHIGNINLKEIKEKQEGYCKKIGDRRFFFFIPTISEFILKIKRKTQIIYPKDISVMIFYSDIKETDNIIEAGTGSGALLTSLAKFVKKGKIISIEKNKQFQDIAVENLLNYFGKFPQNIEMINGDVYSDDFSLNIHENWADKIFLDLPEPWKCVNILRYLREGGILINFNPQITQIKKMIEIISKMNFTDIRVLEILEREWHVDHNRARPVDLMRGHTGFIMFARKFRKEEENGEISGNTTCS